MKFSLVLIAALSLNLFAPDKAHAVASNAVAVSILASDGTTRGDAGATAGTIKKDAWRTVIQLPARAIKGMVVSNQTQVPIQVGVGPSGSEIVQFNVEPQGTYTYGVPGQYYPLSISQGVKVAIRALNSDAAFGVVDVNAFYF